MHSDIKYRFPALTGDLTYLDGEVLGIEYDDAGNQVATVDVKMTTQTGDTMAAGKSKIRLPRE